jgi:hypothetical protein
VQLLPHDRGYRSSRSRTRGPIVGVVEAQVAKRRLKAIEPDDDDDFEESVCAQCFYDRGIQRFIGGHVSAKRCSVCKRTSIKAIAAPAEDVLKFIGDRLEEHYENAYDGSPYDSDSGEYLVPTWDMDELIFEELEGLAPTATVEWVQAHLQDEDNKYCKRGWQIMSHGAALSAGWEAFSKAIKHETRFMFFREDTEDFGEPFLVRPVQMLEELGRAIRRCKLVKQLKAGTRLYRVRGHRPGIVYADGPSLGPPPENVAASSGRMNAPGIAVGYFSFDEDTALDEATGRFTQWSSGAFKLLEDIWVVDLTEIPEIPSIFERGPRESLDFLHKFASDVSQPFTPDTETHVEYAPTQVVSEYLRHRFRNRRKHPMRGVVYWSAKSKGTKNVVLFVGAQEVVGYESSSRLKPKPLLKLMKSCERIRRKKSHGKSH